MAPTRIRLSRAKGWHMPENTLKVDRSTKWGNPFVVSSERTAEYCVQFYRCMLGGYFCVSGSPTVEEQRAALDYVKTHIGELRGKKLGCWCAIGKPCHSDVLLEIANRPVGEEGA